MIKNILIAGFGAVGAFYASKIPDAKVYADSKRIKYYKSNPTFINGKECDLDFINSNNKKIFDLIIISVKYYNLEELLPNLQNFIDENTIIISLINGISSENIIKTYYPNATVVKSFLMCNSMVRNGRNIIHDGINKIVFENNQELEIFFKKHNINYEISKNIKYDMWQKFMLNITANQLSAVTKMSFKEMNELPYIEKMLKNILEEVKQIAIKDGIDTDYTEIMTNNTIQSFRNMSPYGKTSMLQDIENNRNTEIDAFAGEIIRLGKKYNIKTPYNSLFYYLINSI